MPCTPLAIQSGLFLTNANWSTASNASSANGRSVSIGSFGVTIEDENGNSNFFSAAGNVVIKHMFFGDNHLAILFRRTTTPGDITVSIADFSGSSPALVNVMSGGIQGSTTDDPVIQPSQGNGNVFCGYFADGSGPLADLHALAIYRSDNGDVLCSMGVPFHPEGQTIGEATATQLIIHWVNISGSQTTACPLPEGECSINPDTLNFTERVIGGPPGTTTETKAVTIENTGSDCLEVQSIADSGPYSTDFSGPVSLSPGEDITVNVTFAPTAIGAFNGVDLNVTCNPANGDDKITCNGSARNPIRSIAFVPSSVAFGRHPIGTTTTEQLTIMNDGELPLTVNVAAGAGTFTWSAVNNVTLAVGATQTINIDFVPPATGSFSDTITVDSNAPSSPDTVSLSGQGCAIAAEIAILNPGPHDLGEVQQGFRTVKVVRVGNPGTAQLTFRARIQGADAALFGLTEEDSITTMDVQRDFVVNPTNPCGSGPSGAGEVEVPVGFFANQAPGPVSAELVIENHNATDPATPASFTIPLSATIIQPIDVDAALVLDRSGSMSQVIGARTKSQASLAAGRLFASLIRPDVADRITTVKYNHNVNVMQTMARVVSGAPGGADEANQTAFVNQINSTELNPDGNTAIAGGVIAALAEIAKPRATIPDALNKFALVLTDGKDNTGYLNPDDGQIYSLLGGEVLEPTSGPIIPNMVDSLPLTVPNDVKIYGVGIGKTENIDAGRLNALAQSTDAYFGAVNTDLTGANYFDLEKYFVQVFMDAVDLSTIADPVLTIHAGQKHEIPFVVLSGDVGGLAVVFDRPDQGRLPFYLETPLGEIIDVTSVPPGFQARPGQTDTARFIEFRVPQGEVHRYAGSWHLVVEHNGEVCFDDPKQKEGVMLTAADLEGSGFGFHGGRCRETEEPVDYGYSIGVGTNLKMDAFVSPEAIYIGDPIKLTALVAEAGLPCTDCDVVVEAHSPSGVQSSVTLYDDGAHDDGDADDGTFANLFTATNESGSYNFRFRATGYARDGSPIVREAMRAKYVAKPGEDLVDKPSGDGGLARRCCRIITRLLLVGLVLLLLILLQFWLR